MQLFEILTAAVARDSAGSGLVGRVALGVRTIEGDVWWTIELGPKPTVALSSGPPAPNADAKLFMGEEEAACLAEGRALPEPPILKKQGNESLMRAFFARYLIERSPISTRFGAKR